MLPRSPSRWPVLIAGCLLGGGPLVAQTPSCLPVFGTPFEAPFTLRGLAGGDGAPALAGGAAAVAAAGCPDAIAPAPDTALGRWLPAHLQAGYRTAYPGDRNNGVLWSGRGASQAVSAGAALRLGRVGLTLYPTVALQENRAFETAAGSFEGSPLRYPWHRLDWPQRFGEGGYWKIHPGQSALTLDLGPVRAGAATENLWWGPADRYPILLSSTAGGFPHVRLGSAGPVWIGIGHLEATVLWGRLDESAYYDGEVDNDHRLLTLVAFAYRPWFVPGLRVGAALLQHNPWAAWRETALELLIWNGADNAPGNGLVSFTGEWRLPESRLRVYGEWAREDYALNVEDFITEIDHAQAYMLGLEKWFAPGSTPLRVRWELVHLGRSHTQSTRSLSSFYVHNRVRQGHTHDGQLLGAAVGPGSNAQFFALDATLDARVLGAYAERVRRDDDSYEVRFGRAYGFRGHDLETTLGLYGVEALGPLSLQWDLAASRRKNRNFIGLDGVSWDFLRETNVALTLGAWWRPEL